LLKKLYNGENKNPVSLRNRVRWLKLSLRRDAGAGRAHLGAGTAILALGGVDDIESVTFGDGVLRAFCFTRAAGNTIRSDLISHGDILSLFGLTRARIAQALPCVNNREGRNVTSSGLKMSSILINEGILHQKFTLCSRLLHISPINW
jgi:hypothetical protein